MREALLRAAGAGAPEVAQQAIEDWATGRLRTYEDAERGLCFGRIDSEEAADPPYVGRGWVHGDGRRARGAPRVFAPPVLRRRALDPRRRPPRAGRQLAGAGGAALLHRNAGRAA